MQSFFGVSEFFDLNRNGGWCLSSVLLIYGDDILRFFVLWRKKVIFFSSSFLVERARKNVICFRRPHKDTGTTKRSIWLGPPIAPQKEMNSLCTKFKMRRANMPRAMPINDDGVSATSFACLWLFRTSKLIIHIHYDVTANADRHDFDHIIALSWLWNCGEPRSRTHERSELVTKRTRRKSVGDPGRNVYFFRICGDERISAEGNHVNEWQVGTHFPYDQHLSNDGPNGTNSVAILSISVSGSSSREGEEIWAQPMTITSPDKKTQVRDTALSVSIWTFMFTWAWKDRWGNGK